MQPHYTTETTSSLFYYCSIRDEHRKWVKEMIVDNKIYFKTRDQLNDPFELLFTPSFEATTTEKIERLAAYFEKKNKYSHDKAIAYASSEFLSRSKEKLQEWEQKRLSQYQKCLDNSGIFCLSEIPDDILMWSHYANDHKGICIEFKVDVSKKPYILWSIDGQDVEPLPVKYPSDEQLPTVNFYTTQGEDWVVKALLTKSKHWKYEKEWRIPLFDKGKGYRKIPAGLISGVILGHNASQDSEKFIRDLAKQNSTPIKIKKASMIEGFYKLEIGQIL